jgi:Zn-dependent protease
VTGLAFILLLFACVVLHELGHALAARRYGIQTADITLLPIGGVARITRMPRDPRQELVIAVAGPAVSIAIALALYAVLGRWGNLRDILALEDPRLALLAKLLTANVWLVLFNLIPAFPMDGGRMLRALLAMRMPHSRATQIAATIGQAIAFGFGFLGLLGNPILIFIALFVYLGAAQEASLAQMRDVTERVPVSAAMITGFRALGTESTVQHAIDILLQTSQHEFPVVDAAGRLAGVLTRDDLITALAQVGPTALVTGVMRTGLPEVDAESPVDQAFELMQEKQSPVVVVRGADGRLAGIVTPENVGELLMVNTALRRRRPAGSWLGARSGGGPRRA